ncbi:hypothetical protein [Domibacillus enclensis]|uniref:Peptidase propeptide and YPEB domain-containing protein n=1 Tax=Domibacillus enclensis TaxID=1017273 RepID=A0A1N6XWL0_9BACI|nr:hypothetical protein [Domibacillus enclensis]SIR06686.1 hypothetical protein SAMN05443094_10575 [Domibacillus enclensis]
MSRLTKAMSVSILLFIAGCSNANDVIRTEKTRPAEADGLVIMKANDEVKEAAQTFLKEKGWDKQATDIALAQTVEDPQYAEWVDHPAKGELVAVSFLEKESSVIGVPVVYVDPESNKVAGYMPGE